MATSNPALNDKAFERQFGGDQAGWAAGQRTRTVPGAPAGPSVYSPMTVKGSITATAVLLTLLVAAGAVGWSQVSVGPRGEVALPGWVMVSWIAGFGLAIATIFRPQWARITGPLYALTMGLGVGAISKLYDQAAYEGIVMQAILGTVGVLAVMLFLHATRIVKVTDKFRMVVVCATGAIALVYLVNFVLRFFGTQVPFIHESGAIGIGISLVIVVVAALNLSLDFDFIERGVRAGAPKQTEWYAAFGLLVTLVWLYLEILRLLAKLNRR